MKVTLMADIPVRADVCCEEFAGVLEILCSFIDFRTKG
jgi:hypothetical protein